MKTPCYFCDKENPGKRHPGCHATCKDYAEWKAGETEKLNKRISATNDMDRYFSYQKDAKKRLQRRAGKR